MSRFFSGLYHSLPIQLLLLHFRRYQVFLLFWYILFATVAGHFMRPFGANALYLSPEYLGKVNFISTAFVGAAVAVFIMSWNIATFILHSNKIKFLATTAQPFLKFYINNAILPLAFLVFYCYKAIEFSRNHQLMSYGEIFLLMGGFALGFLLITSISFGYFFGADKRIFKAFAPFLLAANNRYVHTSKRKILPPEKSEIKVKWFLTALFSLRKPRDVRHYSMDFLNSIFRRHHLAAVVAILAAFIFLVIIGYLLDYSLFVFPAAASATILFSVLIGVAGATSFFLRSWAVPLLILVYLAVNFLYQKQVINTRNKAYGLNYTASANWPVYSKEVLDTIASDKNMQYDRQMYLQRLETWKKRQGSDKPVAFIVCASGGGLRSATFTMNVLQQLDSLTAGKFLNQTVLISGASGGMFGAAYFRELYKQRLQQPELNLQNRRYVEDVGKDLLNPLFSSLVSRDLIGPPKQVKIHGYRYNKDRAYAFEKQLNENTQQVLNKRLQDYRADEDSAKIPTLILNAVITMDGRKLITGTRPFRFLMRNFDTTGQITPYIDGIDFYSFFAKQNPGNLGMLSALRMNATFPFVLPNVWMPSRPVIDVMDAGLRDNTGIETALKFVHQFKDWFQQNTERVVIIQVRDREINKWEVDEDPPSLIGVASKPFLLLQNNWYRMQDYSQNDLLSFMHTAYGPKFNYVCFQYIPSKEDAIAALSFHLTASEKKDIRYALKDSTNRNGFSVVTRLSQ